MSHQRSGMSQRTQILLLQLHHGRVQHTHTVLWPAGPLHHEGTQDRDNDGGLQSATDRCQGPAGSTPCHQGKLPSEEDCFQRGHDIAHQDHTRSARHRTGPGAQDVPPRKVRRKRSGENFRLRLRTQILGNVV